MPIEVEGYNGDESARWPHLEGLEPDDEDIRPHRRPATPPISEMPIRDDNGLYTDEAVENRFMDPEDLEPEEEDMLQHRGLATPPIDDMPASDDAEKYTGDRTETAQLEDLGGAEALSPGKAFRPAIQAPTTLASMFQPKLVDKWIPRAHEEERNQPLVDEINDHAGSEPMDLETPDLESIERFDTNPQAMDVDEPPTDNTQHVPVTPPDVITQLEPQDTPQSEIPDVAPPELPDVIPAPKSPSVTPHLEETSITQQSAIAAELPLAGVRLWLDVGYPDIQDLSRRIKVSTPRKD